MQITSSRSTSQPYKKTKRNKSSKSLHAYLISFLLLAGCLLSKNVFADNVTTNNPVDPYENFNRGTYQFNKTLDKAVMKPVAVFYKKLLPWPVTKGVSNFFCNINQVPTIINDALQGNGYCVARDTTRLIINTTVGLGGLIDVASCRDLPNHSQDFGLTLAKWGYKCSNYLVLPLLGPSTIRDTIALPVDYYVFSVYPYIFPDFWTRASLLGLYFIDERSQLLAFEGVMKEAAVDEYAFQRDAYLQHRASRIAENNACCGEPNASEKNPGSANEAYVATTTTTTISTSPAEQNYVPGGADISAGKPSSPTASGNAEDNYVPGG